MSTRFLRLLAAYALRFLALGVTEPVYNFSIEFTTGSFTDLTTKVERGNWGSTIIDLLQPPHVNQGVFELSNDNGLLTPRNNANLKPGKAVKLTATYGGSTYPLFYGRLTDISMSPRVGARTTLLTAVDDWDRIRRLTYNTSLFAGTSVQSVFCTLMSLSSVRSFSVDASISDSVGFVWYRDRDAESALYELVQSFNYSLLLDGNGTYYLRDRYWSLFATGVNTYSTADELITSLSEESVINRMKMTVTPRQLSSAISTLSYIPQPIFIPASSSVGFWLSYQDPREPSADVPVNSLVTPVASTDFYGSVASDGTGTNLTSAVSINFTPFAASAVCSVTNGGGTDMWLSRFQIRGYPVLRLPPLSAQFDISSSQALFGVRGVTIDNAVLQNYPFMDSFARTVSVERKDGRDTVRLTLANEFPDLLGNNPGGPISTVDAFGGYSVLWRIRGTNHDLQLAGGLRHSEEADAEAYDTLPFLVLDHPTMGQLDAGRVLGI